MSSPVSSSRRSPDRSRSSSPRKGAMHNVADEASLFCLEIFVDTVDYMQLSLDVKQPEITDFIFIFSGFPPLVIPAPDTIKYKHAKSWITTRTGQKRLRVTYQAGKSALFEAQPTNLSNRLRARPLQILAVCKGDKEVTVGGGKTHRLVRGNCCLPMNGFHPPQAGGWARLGGKGSSSWGCDERAVPIKVGGWVFRKQGRLVCWLTDGRTDELTWICSGRVVASSQQSWMDGWMVLSVLLRLFADQWRSSVVSAMARLPYPPN